VVNHRLYPASAISPSVVPNLHRYGETFLLQMDRLFIGFGVASYFGSRRGDRVIATARCSRRYQKSRLHKLNVLQLDVTAGFEAIKARLTKLPRLWGQIDVLVNNAGADTLECSRRTVSSRRDYHMQAHCRIV